jgi:N6-L-threonylcarbamoyladenine synthase
MIILGIETSCDETAISLVEAQGDLDSLSFKLLGSAVNSQIQIHSEYGGVVPNLAKREHQKNLLPVLIEALKKANLISNVQFSIFNKFSNLEEFLNEIEKPKIDLIAVTVGPGLEPALWTGISFAEELGKSWGKAGEFL